MEVVFTGPAFAHGQAILREALTLAANEVGIKVLPRIKPGVSCLVASRTDTVKARNAEELGIRVIDYQTFIDQYLEGEVPVSKAGRPNKFVDTHQPMPSGTIGDMTYL